MINGFDMTISTNQLAICRGGCRHGFGWSWAKALVKRGKFVVLVNEALTGGSSVRNCEETLISEAIANGEPVTRSAVSATNKLRPAAVGQFFFSQSAAGLSFVV
jgi:hypothetical protein